MNSHIQALANIALDKTVPETWTTLSREQLRAFQEEFAALLIKEACTVMNAASQESRDQYTYMGEDPPTFVLQCKIQEYFGVDQ